MKTFALVAALLAFALPVAAADTVKTDIDALVAQVLREIPDIPSVGIAVVRDGKPFYANAYGFADREAQTRATARTGYYIASSTKSYTGLACAVLAARGKLDLDAPLSKYLPEVTGDAGKFTLRQYLTHSAPVINEPVVIRTAYTGEHTPAMLVSLLNSSKPRKEGFQYDNLGYVVASLVIERVTGKPWQRALDEIVFAPLKMKDTTAYMSEAEKRALATPYETNRKTEMVRLEYRKSDQMMHAAGGIVTTPDDLQRWLVANINAAKPIPAAAYAEAQKQQVATPSPVVRDAFKGTGYGFGWYQADYAGDKVLFHLGGFEGWRAHVSFMPERKAGVAVVINAGAWSGRLANMIAAAIYDRVLDKPDAQAASLAAVAKFKTELETQRQRGLAEIEKRAQRPWMLKHANAAYAGRYENALFGAITIEQRGDKLFATLAKMTSEVEAFTEPESARVELPPGNGSVLRFAFNGDSVASLTWDDEVFVKR